MCKFNTVLVNLDPHDETKLIASPAWWEESLEQLCVNLFEDLGLKMKIGADRLDKVTYENVTKVFLEKVYHSYSQPTMLEMVNVPAPRDEQIAYLPYCKGYEHCDISPQQIEGFFITNHMDITDAEVFREFEVLCNDLLSCFKVNNA